VGNSVNPRLNLVAKMTLRAVLVACLTSAVVPAQDLSKYGAVQLGTDLVTVAKRTGVSLTQVKVIHRRPVLIQELEWRSDATARRLRKPRART
jgi:hypothetical protein